MVVTTRCESGESYTHWIFSYRFEWFGNQIQHCWIQLSFVQSIRGQDIFGQGRGSAGVKGTNYHSRNPSLLTLSSASLLSPGTIPVPVGRGGVYGGTTSSLVHTPQSNVAWGEPLVNSV